MGVVDFNAKTSDTSGKGASYFSKGGRKAVVTLAKP